MFNEEFYLRINEKDKEINLNNHYPNCNQKLAKSFKMIFIFY